MDGNRHFWASSRGEQGDERHSRRVRPEGDPSRFEECSLCGEQGSVYDPKSMAGTMPEGWVMQICSNQHFLDRPCAVEYFDRQTTKEGRATQLTCVGCDEVLSTNTISALVEGASSVLFRSRFDANAELLARQVTVPCPGLLNGKPCLNGFERDSRALNKLYKMTCSVCSTTFCLGCGAVPPHTETDCAEVDAFQITDIGLPVADKIRVANNEAAICQCGVVIERTAGCTHMTHVVAGCRVEFCYLCKSHWNWARCECAMKPVSCVKCGQRSVRIQVGTEHFVCKGARIHEFCNACKSPWDSEHEGFKGCPVQGASVAAPTRLSV